VARALAKVLGGGGLRGVKESTMRLSDEQVRQYLDDGFLVVEDVFTRQELQPVLAGHPGR
jgi:hypothetical protein